MRHGFIDPGRLGSEDRIPGKTPAPRHFEDQRDIAVGQRDDRKTRLQARQPRNHIGPRIEPTPRHCQIGDRHIVRVDIVLRQQRIERLAIENIEPGIGAAPRTTFLHRRLIQTTPRIGERGGIHVPPTERAEERRRFARDAATPIDDGAEDVEGQNLYQATISRSAAITPRVSFSVPIVMRKPLPSPCPGSQRTI